MRNCLIAILISSALIASVGCDDAADRGTSTDTPVIDSKTTPKSVAVPSPVSVVVATNPAQPTNASEEPIRVGATAPPEPTPTRTSTNLKATVAPCGPTIDDADPCEPGTTLKSDAEPSPVSVVDATSPAQPITASREPIRAAATTTTQPATTRTSTYLEATVEPCVPTKLSADPCADAGAGDSNDSHSGASLAAWSVVTIEDDMILRSLNERGRYTDVPHFVVRGTYVPDTTRCAVTGMGTTLSSRISEPDPDLEELIATAEAKYEADPETLEKLPTTYPPTLITCVTDLAVNEYMAGRGPAVLTLVTFSRVAFLYIHDIYERYEADPGYDFGYDLWVLGFADEVAEPIEDKEKVIWVGTPANLAVKAWRPVHTCDLVPQDSEILVARDDAWYHIRNPDDYAAIVHTLADYRQKVSAAHSKLVETHDGRMGDHEDLPMLVLDANDEFLEELLVAEGAYQFNKTPLSIPTPDPDFQYPTPTPHPTSVPQPTATLYPTPYPIDLSARVVQTDDGLSIVLTWNVPSPDEGVAGYTVWRNDERPELTWGPVNEGLQITGPGTSHIDTFEVEPDTTYVYTLEYMNSRGGGIRTSKQVEITTPSE